MNTFSQKNEVELSFHMENKNKNTDPDFLFSAWPVPISKQHRLVNAIDRISFTAAWHYTADSCIQETSLN